MIQIQKKECDNHSDSQRYLVSPCWKIDRQKDKNQILFFSGIYGSKSSFLTKDNMPTSQKIILIERRNKR
jgi:hypothetical protein